MNYPNSKNVWVKNISEEYVILVALSQLNFIQKCDRRMISYVDDQCVFISKFAVMC